jgi:hypothetical protein
MKIHSVGDEFFHADGQADGRADITKLRVASCNSANVPKKGIQDILGSD